MKELAAISELEKRNREKEVQEEEVKEEGN